MGKQLFDSMSPWELESILNSIDDAIFIDDSQGHALWCNRACEELYQIRAKDVRGMHVSELEQQGVFSPSVATIVLAEERQATIIHENKNGRKLLSTGTPIPGPDGRISKIITTSRDITELSTLQNQLEEDQVDHEALHDSYARDWGIIAFSDAMVQALQLAEKLADVDSTVLLTGESGVGKGVVASFIHASGNRKEGPFITVNCGAIPESLIESELFGYEQGAFTGASKEGHKGFFEAADGGTIFLDEISELPLGLQVKLLQVIQERFITRVGGTQRIPVNVRIISATNRNLKDQVRSGHFREDLYYRLNVIPISVPPLRERTEDITPLIHLFLDRYNETYERKKTLSKEAIRILNGFSWPGNIRELQNIVERLVLTSPGDRIDEHAIPEFIIEGSMGGRGERSSSPSLSEAMDRAEERILREAAKSHTSTRSLARALGTSQPTVVRKLNKHGISLD